MSDQTYRAIIGERTFDFTFEDGRLLMDGDPVDYTFAPTGDRRFSLILNGVSTPMVVEAAGESQMRVTIDGRTTLVRVQDEQALLLEEFGLAAPGAVAEREVRAPMPGLVLKLTVKEGDEVEADAPLLVLEAMKMENELRAPAAGVVQAVHVGEGDAVNKDDVLIEIDTDAD